MGGYVIRDMSPAPPDDLVFQYLLSEAAVTGRIAVWGIVVSAARLIAFNPTFRPEDIGKGPAIVAAIISQWAMGKPPQPWVYPRGDMFVVADDYYALAAIRQADAGTVACQCLGEPDPALVYDRVGPIPLTDVRDMLGVRVAE